MSNDYEKGYAAGYRAASRNGKDALIAISDLANFVKEHDSNNVLKFTILHELNKLTERYGKCSTQ